MCGSTVQNLIHVTVLASRILRWLLDVWKMTSVYSTDTADHFRVVKKDRKGRKKLIFIIGRVRKIAKSNCLIRHVCLSTRPQGKTLLPLDGFQEI